MTKWIFQFTIFKLTKLQIDYIIFVCFLRKFKVNEKKKIILWRNCRNSESTPTLHSYKPKTNHKHPKNKSSSKEEKQINKHGRPKQSRSRTLTWNLREAPPNLRSHRFARLCDLSPRNRAALGRLRSDLGCWEAHEQPPRLVLDSLARSPIGRSGTHQETICWRRWLQCSISAFVAAAVAYEVFFFLFSWDPNRKNI